MKSLNNWVCVIRFESEVFVSLCPRYEVPEMLDGPCSKYGCQIFGVCFQKVRFLNSWRLSSKVWMQYIWGFYSRSEVTELYEVSCPKVWVYGIGGGLQFGWEVSELFEAWIHYIWVLSQCVRFLNDLMICVPRFNLEVFICLCSGCEFPKLFEDVNPKVWVLVNWWGGGVSIHDVC